MKRVRPRFSAVSALMLLCAVAVYCGPTTRTEIVERFPRGEKRIVVTYEGSGTGEFIVERHWFNKAGILVRHERPLTENTLEFSDLYDVSDSLVLRNFMQGDWRDGVTLLSIRSDTLILDNSGMRGFDQFVVSFENESRLRFVSALRADESILTTKEYRGWKDLIESDRKHLKWVEENFGPGEWIESPRLISGARRSLEYSRLRLGALGPKWYTAAILDTLPSQKVRILDYWTMSIDFLDSEWSRLEPF